MNIDNIIKKVLKTVKSHRLENEGEYARWIWQDENNSRELGINEYGCADAINILYTIGEFPNTEESRKAHINALSSLQNKETGVFAEKTHHPIHTTAHCIAALELFDAKPKYPLSYLIENYGTNEGLVGLLEGLDWVDNPWDMSHRGAGIYAAMTLSESVDEAWQDTYFKWLWENADEETGFWRKGCVTTGKKPYFHHLAGTFHYLFNHEYAKMPLRYPEKVIDTCLSIFKELGFTQNLRPDLIGFSAIDWVYCLTRASRQTRHRHAEVKEALLTFAREYIKALDAVDEKTNDDFNDLHALFGAICALAELQQALPGMIKSTKPLKLVLDRRPFI